MRLFLALSGRGINAWCKVVQTIPRVNTQLEPTTTCGHAPVACRRIGSRLTPVLATGKARWTPGELFGELEMEFND